jgi:hypothetical protein
MEDCVQLCILKKTNAYRKLYSVAGLAFAVLKFGHYWKLKYYETEDNPRQADRAGFKATYVI